MDAMFFEQPNGATGTPALSCAFATSVETPAYIEIAEELGFERAWCYDSPALHADVWTILGIAADRTRRIGIGPAVLVPSLRHVMTNATAIATLAALAPGRVAIAVGTGATGRFALGQRPLAWADVAAYIRALKGLLRGETVEWEGAPTRMLHPPGWVAPRPVDVPILVAAEGPRGYAVASELGDGVMSVGRVPDRRPGLPAWRAMLTFGTVLDDGDDVGSERVAATAGPGLAALYHMLYEWGGADAVASMPGGDVWHEHIATVPPEERHLATHEGHLMRLTERDRAAVAANPHVLPTLTLTGTGDAIREQVRRHARAGITEIVYQPAGPDIPRELSSFMQAMRG